MTFYNIGISVYISTGMDLLLIYFKFGIICPLDVPSKFADFLAKHDADLLVIIQRGKEMKIRDTGTRANNFLFISSQLTNKEFYRALTTFARLFDFEHLSVSKGFDSVLISFRISTSHVLKTLTFPS